MLMNIPSDNIITYHGSFRQNGTYNLILDYADGGSLKDLLDKQVPPSTTEGIEQFWRSLFGVLNGLQSIHQWMGPDGDDPIRGIHEDIKPDNILLFKGRSGSAYDFIPKVADFGLFSHVRQSKASSSEAMGLDNHGNQRYNIEDVEKASPEIVRDGANRTGPQLRITSCEVDLEPAVESGQFKDSGCGSSQASNIQGPHENGTELVHRRTSKSSSALDARCGPLTLEELGQYRIAMKSGQDPDPLAQEVVDFILHNLAGRDQFFFIDDSTSMKDYAPVVDKTFLSLSWLTKRLDPDKLELSFASAPTAIFKAKKTKKLSKRVSEQEYRRDPTLMESSFGHLVDEVLIPRLPRKFSGLNFNPFARRQMSVYIFTDGNWGGKPGVERPLRRLMKKMQKRDLDRNQVSLHFIRFGSLMSGRNNLRFLDDFGRDENWDIVDVKDVSHPLADILIGPMSPDVDNRDYDS
ncbi:hypothetical protein DL768_000759 [Monosporascus sp. mg162]|nr:hypothetical protein DL768_000759 [Monosporascus sp. mg162]